MNMLVLVYMKYFHCVLLLIQKCIVHVSLCTIKYTAVLLSADFVFTVFSKGHWGLSKYLIWTNATRNVGIIQPCAQISQVTVSGTIIQSYPSTVPRHKWRLYFMTNLQKCSHQLMNHMIQPRTSRINLPGVKNCRELLHVCYTDSCIWLILPSLVDDL